MNLNWQEATLAQLYEIAYNDQECNPRYKIEALEELQRRNRNRQFTRINYVEKKVYPH